MKIEMLNKAKDIIQTVNLLRCGNILQQLIDEVDAKPKSNAKPAFASSVFECPARDGDGALVVGLIVYSYKNGENHCECRMLIAQISKRETKRWNRLRPSTAKWNRQCTFQIRPRGLMANTDGATD
jgi:hypothetical protein